MNQTASKQIVIVLGMHRSGTSAITKGLQALGVDLGERLMPAREGDNARGYFEDLDVFNLNERIFSALGTTWDAVSPIDKGEFSHFQLDALKLEAIEILQKRLRHSKLWGFKDPRTCRLLPFWQEIFSHIGLNCRYLFAVRNPLSVAKSLGARNGFPAAKSHLLWLQYVLSAMNGTGGRPRLVVDFDVVMGAPKAQLQRIANWMNLPVDGSRKKSIDAYAADFLTEDLRHSVFRDEDLKYDSSLGPLAVRAYGWLRKLANDEVSFDNSDFLNDWAEISEMYELTCPVFRFIDAQESRLAGLHQTVLENEKLKEDNIRRGEWGVALKAELDALQKLMAEKETSIQELSADNVRRGEWGIALQAELDALRKLISDKDAAYQALAVDDARRGERGTALQTELDALRKLITRRDAAYQALAVDNARSGERELALQTALDALRKLITDKDAAYQALAMDNARRGEKELALQTVLDALRKLITDKDAAYQALAVDNARRGEIELALQAKMNGLGKVLTEKDAAYQELAAKSVTLGERVYSLQTEVDALQTLIKEKDAAAQKLAADVCHYGDAGFTLRTEIATLRNSRSWKITTPLRYLVAKKRRAALMVQQPKLSLVALSRAVYHRLPISSFKRRRLLAWCFRSFPNLLRGRPSFEIWKERREKLSAVMTVEPGTTTGDSGNTLALNGTKSKPAASIIIPVHGQLAYTLQCIQALAVMHTKVSYEIIVVDDCSPDESVETLVDMPGIRLIGNDKNLGFIRSCNRGASEAQGEFLVFLNNDTAVQAGWLDALLQTFSDFPDCGLAGSKLMYPDGRMQEAGGIIWNDASGWNFGRLDDPNRPEYNYVREVDYCSGASIMIRRDLFATLGGFDERYVPAYFEDADLAFSVHQHGLKVLYQPKSVVVHYEGITSGTDLSSGAKSYQVINREKFAAKWAQRLALHRTSGEAPVLERDRFARGRMLVIDARTPTPDQDAGSVTAYFYLKSLVDLGYKVTFIPENLIAVEKYTEMFQQLGVECLYAPYLTSVSAYLEAFGPIFDYVMPHRAYTANAFIDDVKRYCKNAKVIFNTVDLHYLREERQAELSGSHDLKMRSAQTKAIELSLMRKADVSIVVSTAERDLLLSEDPSLRLATIPLLLDVPGCRKPFEQRRDIMFIGGYEHTPNVDAVKFFVNEIWPRIFDKLPDAKFLILGSKMPEEVKMLGSVPGVKAIGYVEKVDEYFDNCRLSVAPLRFGAGIKGKIGKSASFGVPCVATTLAVEGMGMQSGTDILVADNPEEFSQRVVELYTSKDLWMQISANGLRFVESNYSLQVGKEHLKLLL